MMREVPFSSFSLPQKFEIPGYSNPYAELPIGTLFSKFERVLAQQNEKSETPEQILRDNAKAMGWKTLYKTYKTMSRLWTQKCTIAVLIAGQKGSGKSEVFTQLLKLIIKPTVITAPNGVQVASGVTKLRLKGKKDNQPLTISLCEVRTPRNWHSPYFRGSQANCTHLIYTLDCKQFANTSYRSTVFREFHGTLGEAHDAAGPAVGLMMRNYKQMKPEKILQQLRIVPHEISDDFRDCPYYASPIWVAAMYKHAEQLSASLSSLMTFFFGMPTDYPQDHLDSKLLELCRLIDGDLPEERWMNFASK